MSILGEFILRELTEAPPLKGRQRALRRLVARIRDEFPGLARRAVLDDIRALWGLILLSNPAGIPASVRLRRIRRLEVAPQRTADWTSRRQALAITGTNVGAVIKGETYASWDAELLRKLRPEPYSDDLRESPPACRHGTIFEDVAKEFLCRTRETFRVHEVGLVVHPDLPPDMMGASPDGIVDGRGLPFEELLEDHGRLLEIKCPFSRKIDGKIKPEYFQQMQLQMEVTDIDSCVFAELEFESDAVNTWEELAAYARPHLARGFFLLDPEGRKRVGFRLWLPGDPIDIEEARVEGKQVCLWILRVCRTQVVLREPDWMTKHLPNFLKFYEARNRHREAGTIPESRRVPTTVIDLRGPEEPEPTGPRPRGFSRPAATIDLSDAAPEEAGAGAGRRPAGFSRPSGFATSKPAPA